MSFEVKDELSHNEIILINKLRYDVYIDELGYSQPNVCHKQKLLFEPRDLSGNLFGIFKHDAAIATCLTNYTKNCDLGYYPKLYNMKKLDVNYLQYSSITTKMIIHKDYRKSTVLLKLAFALYLKGLKDQIKYNFIECSRELISLYSRLGYIVHEPTITHPDFGEGTVMVLELENEKRLIETGSPLLQYLRELRS